VFRMDFTGLREFAGALEEIKALAEAAARRNVAEGAAIVEAAAKRNFSGAHKRNQPHVGGDKPNIVSGMLRRSIGHEPITKTGFASFSTKLGPRTVYGRRVELGFCGEDSRGRKYQQRPYKYFEPAVKGSRGALEAMALRNWGSIVR
jgi:hypothetical protein